MGEYDSFKPKDDWGSSYTKDDGDDGYQPGGGAMVAMGYDSTEYGIAQQYNPYTGYAPGMAMTDYPHGPFDEPDMGFEWGGWGRRARARVHGAWKDKRGFWARLFNRPMAPAVPVTAAATVSGYAPPPPAVAPPAAEMGWEWHDRRPEPPNGGGYPGQWRRGQQFGQMPGQPAPPMGMQGIGQPAPPQLLNTWARWQQVHPGTPYSDYSNWYNQYGRSGGSINGEW